MDRAVLLLDAHCSPCSKFGKQIVREGLTEGSILEIGSLHDPRYEEHVGKMEPTLLRFDNGSVAVSTGLRVATGLLGIVGLRRAFRIAQLARAATAEEGFDQSRRSFLLRAAGAAAALPMAGVLGVKTATATEEETKPTAPSPLTLAEAQAAYALLRASSEYAEAHKAAVADGVRHPTSATLRAEGEAFVGDSVFIHLGEALEGERFITFVLIYVDGQGNSAAGYMMQAVVDAVANRVLVAIHIDASDIAEAVTIPAGSVTAGLANVRGVIHNSIEARARWTVEGDGVSVPVELIRIVPGANLVEVDEDAQLATTTHGLASFEITITQKDGTNIYSVHGSIGQANLAFITDGDLDSLVAGRETTVYIGPPVATPPAALVGPTLQPPPGTIRFKGKNVDIALTNGVWSGTPLQGVRGASSDCTVEEVLRCAMRWVIIGYHTVCKWLPWPFKEICTLAAIWGSVMVCDTIQFIQCAGPPQCPPPNCYR